MHISKFYYLTLITTSKSQYNGDFTIHRIITIRLFSWKDITFCHRPPVSSSNYIKCFVERAWSGCVWWNTLKFCQLSWIIINCKQTKSLGEKSIEWPKVQIDVMNGLVCFSYKESFNVMLTWHVCLFRVNIEILQGVRYIRFVGWSKTLRQIDVLRCHLSTTCFP